MLRSLLTQPTRAPLKLVGSPSLRSLQTPRNAAGSRPMPNLPPEVRKNLVKLGLERNFVGWRHAYQELQDREGNPPPFPPFWFCSLYSAKHKIDRKTQALIADEGGEAIRFYDLMGNGFGETEEEALLE